MTAFHTLDSLNREIISCCKCPRLVAFRENVPPRKSYEDQTYWRKPVPGFGDPNAWLLITGLAPSAHGGNRTGRIFTGDLTGIFLFEALYQAGFANQPYSHSRDDGLRLQGCYLTAMVKCVPPKDKPTRQECLNCHPYYQNELRLLSHVTTILALGKFAFDSVLLAARLAGNPTKKMSFKHGVSYSFENFPKVHTSYHPSPQNTNTGKLTKAMFLDVLKHLYRQ